MKIFLMGSIKAPGVKFWLLAFLTLWLRSVLKPLSASVSPVSAIKIQCQPHREVVTMHERMSDKAQHSAWLSVKNF